MSRLRSLAVWVVACVVGGCRPPTPGPRLPLVATPEAAFRASPPPPIAIALPPDVAPIEVTLPSGLRVIVARRHGARTVVAVVVNRAAGSADTRAPAGLAAIVADMTVRGLGDGDVAASARTDWDASEFSIVSMPEHWDRLVSASARVFDPVSVASTNFAEVLAHRMEQRLARRSRMPVARDVALARLFGATHGYGRPPGGRLDTLRGLTLVDVAGFWLEHYAPQACGLILVGDVEPAEAIQLATREFAAILPHPAPTRQPSNEARPEPGPRVTIIHASDRSQADIVIAIRAPPFNHSHALAMEVVSHVLSGAFSSRLNLYVREGLNVSYGVHGELLHGEDASALLITATVDRNAVGQSLRAMLDEIARVTREPIRDEELARYRAIWREQRTARAETTIEEAQWLARDFIWHRDPATERASIDALTPQMIREVARCYLDPRLAQIAIAGATFDIESQIRPLNLGRPLRVIP